jgi:type IX secretion system PorP/SprF family membrane protein
MGKFISLVFLMFNISLVWGQGRLLSSQYNYNKLSINAAYAGTDQNLDFTLLHRSQWQGVKGAPTQQILTINFPYIKDALGLGLNFSNLSYGITQLINVSVPYSYAITMGKSKLSFGSSINFKSLSENYAKDLTAIDDRQIDNGIPQTNITGRSINFGLGAYLSNKQAFVGISTNSLLKDILITENAILTPNFRSIDFLGGYQFGINKDLNLLVQGMGRIANQLQSTLDINAGVEYQRKMNFGIGMRIGNPVANALLFNSGFYMKNGYVGFAYEYPMSQLRGVQLGSFELIGYYSFTLKKSKYEGFNPRFF